MPAGLRWRRRQRSRRPNRPWARRPVPRINKVQYQTPNVQEWSEDAGSDAAEAPAPANRGRVTVINPEGLTQPTGVTQTSIQPMPSCGCDDGMCSSCDQCDCCSSDFWQHRSFVFGEYLYMKSYGPDFVHANQQNAAPAGQGTVPFGKSQNLIQPWTGAFRAGGGYALSDCSSITATYTQFASHTNDTLGLPTGTNTGSVISSVLCAGHDQLRHDFFAGQRHEWDQLQDGRHHVQPALGRWRQLLRQL